MSEEENNQEILEVAIDDIFSDTDLLATERLFQKHLEDPFDNLIEKLHDQIVLPSIELINYRLKAENNPMYLAECLHDFLVETKNFEENQEEEVDNAPEKNNQEIEIQEVLGYFIKMTDELIKEHDHWHEKRCHVKSEIREKINNLRNLMESIGVYE